MYTVDYFIKKFSGIPPYKDVTKKLAVLPVDEVPDVKIIKELEVV